MDGMVSLGLDSGGFSDSGSQVPALCSRLNRELLNTGFDSGLLSQRPDSSSQQEAD